MRSLAYLVLVVLLLMTCGRKECQDFDEQFSNLFEANLGLIIKSGYRTEGSLDSLTNAFLFMEAITGIKPRISDYDTPHYKNMSYFYEDIRDWKEWFDKNKCEMTYSKADSILKVKNFY